ncbi:uncharacterized protein PGTG_10418 [Puccinia graminis f. sp. tritici CRL 75-36-700-3]|uniref:Uncharacterized protein n=1 Tax=Puccinia graminis f. sp. tritici (strain CRL 75-36-700-3 / race SCCL) TaxID=418459 RepID=E3KKX2_PUCGT|nr:uncharacterized protein PGTG_10418 [Puccinia graminis f. sp. tritici CRL 75-36-700-3]EFP84947.1 hypothetical protein PGTG_10418 [Puccinia graminis f. sp. tritici CRL 75-36-700-3]
MMEVPKTKLLSDPYFLRRRSSPSRQELKAGYIDYRRSPPLARPLGSTETQEKARQKRQGQEILEIAQTRTGLAGMDCLIYKGAGTIQGAKSPKVIPELAQQIKKFFTNKSTENLSIKASLPPATYIKLEGPGEPRRGAIIQLGGYEPVDWIADFSGRENYCMGDTDKVYLFASFPCAPKRAKPREIRSTGRTSNAEWSADGRRDMNGVGEAERAWMLAQAFNWALGDLDSTIPVSGSNKQAKVGF